ncbi:unnamed protein product [Rotaria magnacalcarata]|uniref:NAD(P)(+)--arginine ADP-ribosyltransferase n=2 Tax=Rotaria magnacalcarata TaxID=392030 RepID=A0A816RTW3_9BILA|nr:unnamed protein product [Rotaria magnacalcarata]
MAHNKIDFPKANLNRKDRFVDQNVSQLLEINRMPIGEYLNCPLCTLEESVISIVSSIPTLRTIVCQAKTFCNKTSKLLTADESGAIYLYTMPTVFYKQLNQALREQNREALKPWFSFIRLIMSGLEKLPDVSGETIWRGISEGIGSSYFDNMTFTWWSFSSCTRDLKVIEPFIGLSSTVFAIECKRAKDVSDFSAIKDEAEVILMPGTNCHVKSLSLLHEKLYIVHLKEIFEQEQNKLQNEQQATAIATTILIYLSSFVKTASDTAVQSFKKQIKLKWYRSIRTFLDLVNNSDVTLKIEVSDLDNYDWDGDSRPDHVFHNVKIPPYSNVKNRLELNAKSSSAISSMRFKQDGGKDVAFSFKTDQWAAKAPKEKSEEVNLQNGWKAKITVGMDSGETLQYQFFKMS